MRGTGAFTAVALAAMSLAPACALIDGLGSSNGDLCQSALEPDCTGSTCVQPFQLGTAPLVTSVNTCDAVSNAFEIAGCEPFREPGGRTAVFRFQVNVPGLYDICGTSSPTEATLRVSTFCSGTPVDAMCVPDSGDCQTVSLNAGEAFIYFQEAAEGDCPLVDVDIQFVADNTSESNCLDGVDDNGNGLIDCEELSCRGSVECDLGGLDRGETCDGSDDGAVASTLPPGLVDEFACSCKQDTGCDGFGGPAGDYLCHPSPDGDELGYCAPSCNDFNWCGELFGPNGACSPDGHCMQLPVPSVLP